MTENKTVRVKVAGAIYPVEMSQGESDLLLRLYKADEPPEFPSQTRAKLYKGPRLGPYRRIQVRWFLRDQVEVEGGHAYEDVFYDDINQDAAEALILSAFLDRVQFPHDLGWQYKLTGICRNVAKAILIKREEETLNQQHQKKRRART